MSGGSHKPADQLSRLPKVAGGIVALAVFSLVCTMSGDFTRGRSVVIGRKWPPAELVSIDNIDHRDWDRLLQRYVNESGNVGYSDWKGSPSDVQALDAYLASLSRANPDLEARRESRLAFWINAYNAVTIRGILREYPTTPIENWTASRLGFNIWTDLLLRVGGRNYSLDQMEHKLLRPLREPRIHFAIVCGARGCPRLLNRAYQTSDLEQQLRDNSRSFFADPQKLEFDAATGHLRLSPILNWYSKDFGESQAEMLKAIAPYLPDRVSAQLPGSRGLRAGYLDYDSTLNDRAGLTSTAPIPPEFASPDDAGPGKESE